LGFELYAVIGQQKGSGYPLAYLFLDNSKKGDGVRTLILAGFFNSLKHKELSPEFFLTDKDFAQINAALQVWPSTKIQLCLWHIERAINKRLADGSIPKTNSYNAELANTETNLVDVNFHPFPVDRNTGIRSIINCDQKFCPKEFRDAILNMIIYHFHLHPLIPNDQNQFLSTNDIWLLSVQEMYRFCVQNDLKNVWAYLWTNWYQRSRWNLWARAAFSEKISLFRTTMLVEAHWKVIKRDYLPRFFRPRLDLVVFVIINRLLPNYQRRYSQLISGRQKASWRKDIKREWKELMKADRITSNFHVTDVTRWVCSCPSFLKSRWPMCRHLIHNVPPIVNSEFFNTVVRQEVYPFLQHPDLQGDASFAETNHPSNLGSISTPIFDYPDTNNRSQGEQLFREIEQCLIDCQEFVAEQYDRKNYDWIRRVNNKFDGIRILVKDIKAYRKRVSNPKTWKDHNQNTLLLE